MFFTEPDTPRIDSVLENINIINELQNQLKDDGTKTEYEIIVKPIALYPKENCAHDNYSFLNDEFVTRKYTKWPSTGLDEIEDRGADIRSPDTTKPSQESTQSVEDIAVTVSVSSPKSINTNLKVILTILNCTMTACACGFSNSLGVMFVDIIEEFQSSRVEASPILSVSSALMFALGGVWGPLMTRFNGGYICMASGFVILTGCTISTFTTSLPLLIASLGGITGIGLSIPYFLSYVSVPEIYDKHRYIMMSVVSVAPGIGSFVFPYLTLFLIDAYGWRGALLIIGSLFSNCIPIGLLNGYVKKRLLIGHGQSQTTKIKDFLSVPLFKNIKYLISVICMMFFNFLCPTILQVYVDMLTEKGFSLTTGSVLLSACGFSDFGGRVIGLGLFPFIKCSNKTKWAFCMAIISITPFLYTLFFQYEYLLANTILFGLSWGMTMLCFPSMIMEASGPKYFSSALGYCNLIGGVISLIGGLIAGLIKDATGSYNLVYQLTSIMTGVGSLIMVMMVLKIKCTKKREKRTPVPIERF